jgi:hypothetical protein
VPQVFQTRLSFIKAIARESFVLRPAVALENAAAHSIKRQCRAADVPDHLRRRQVGITSPSRVRERVVAALGAASAMAGTPFGVIALALGLLTAAPAAKQESVLERCGRTDRALKLHHERLDNCSTAPEHRRARCSEGVPFGS